jgi:serine/threonine protein kinase
MKLVRGRTLSAAIGNAGSLRERLALLPHFVDLCQAIAYAHSRSVIHRDIKPANVMIGEFGETVVIDWGLAKIRGQEDVHEGPMEETVLALQAGENVERTTYGQVIGMPAYMSPEQARGLQDQIDERADIYSLGAVLYEILTGKRPYVGDSRRDVIRMVTEGDLPPIEDQVEGVPPELIAICYRAMHADPDRRYDGAKTLADETLRFQSGSIVEAYDYTRLDVAARFVSRYKSILITSAAAMVMLLGFSIYYVAQIAQSRDEESAQRVMI